MHPRAPACATTTTHVDIRGFSIAAARFSTPSLAVVLVRSSYYCSSARWYERAASGNGGVARQGGVIRAGAQRHNANTPAHATKWGMPAGSVKYNCGGGVRACILMSRARGMRRCDACLPAFIRLSLARSLKPASLGTTAQKRLLAWHANLEWIGGCRDTVRYQQENRQQL